MLPKTFQNKFRLFLTKYMSKEKEAYYLFQRWYDEYFSFIYLFLTGYFSKRKIEVRESEIEDMVQNVFLAILERKEKYANRIPISIPQTNSY